MIGIVKQSYAAVCILRF